MQEPTPSSSLDFSYPAGSQASLQAPVPAPAAAVRSDASSDAAPPALRIEGLGFRYRGASAYALQGIDLVVQPGEFVVVMGPSGAGKSTLCQALNGLIPHLIRGTMDGRVAVLGRSTQESSVAAMADRIGLVFQDFEAQLFSTNVRLEVAFSAENLGVDREEIARRVARCLADVNLVGFEGRQPASLSGGQKQRLAIASVLAAEPRIICLDEPTTDLDPVGKQEVFQIAGRLREQQVTLVIVEHETAEALVASRLIVMADGRILRDGSPGDVLRDVELFAQSRIMPMQIPDLFGRLGYAAAQRPLTVDDGVAAFARDRLRLSAERHAALVAEDEARAAGYGAPLIEVDALVHRYPTGLAAVQGVSLTIRRGEFVAVLGQNGSGKTTLIKHLNGLLRPSAGAVRVCGKSTADASILEIGAHVGYVFQNPDHQIFSDTVFDEVAFGLRMRKVPEPEIPARVADALLAVDMAGREQDDPFSLTKGQRQRVAVASVLAVRPEVLILDEPTTGLDYQEQKSMMALVRRLNQAGSTIVIVTHAMWVVCEYAHRAVVIKDGLVARDGTVREVFGRPDELAGMSLQPPPVVSLAARLGAAALSVDEMMMLVEREPAA